MRLQVVVVAASLFAAAGAAAQAMHLNVRVSADGADWRDTLDALPGSTVQVGIWVSGEGMYGAGGATLRLTGNGARSGDLVAFGAGTATGRVAPFNFGAATNAIYRDSADTFRIDAAGDRLNTSTTRGLTFFQRDPATAAPGAFSTANPALAMRFTVTLDGSAAARSITIALDQLSRGTAAYFSSASSSRVTLTSNVSFGTGTIRVLVPAPGALTALGLAAVGRRRR